MYVTCLKILKLFSTTTIFIESSFNEILLNQLPRANSHQNTVSNSTLLVSKQI